MKNHFISIWNQLQKFAPLKKRSNASIVDRVLALHAVIFLLMILTLGLLGCGKKNLPKSKPIVLVSVAPYQYVTERIGGNQIKVHSIVTLGADVHHFDPTVRQTQSMNDARIWFRIGEPFEKRLLSIFQNRMPIIDLRENIELINYSEKCSCCDDLDNQDRHMWMSPNILKKQAIVISRVLSEEFPEYHDIFETNLASLLSDLDLLDEEIHHSLEKLKNHTLLVSHPAFGYFCKDYFLNQVSIEYDGKDPCPRYLQFIFEESKKNHPNGVITLPQNNNKGAQMIAKEIQLPLKQIDPYSLDYFGMMHTLTQWISSNDEHFCD